MDTKISVKEVAILNQALNKLCDKMILGEDDWIQMCKSKDQAIRLRCILLNHGCAKEMHDGMIDMMRGLKAEEYRTSDLFGQIYKSQKKERISLYLSIISVIVAISSVLVTIFR